MNEAAGGLVEGRDGDAEDGTRERLGRGEAEGAVDMGEVIAEELIELGAIFGVVVGAVPPAPIAALGDEQFLEGQVLLRLVQLGALRTADDAVIGFAGFEEELPGLIVLPEPDLVPLRISDEWLQRVVASMPELPADMRRRFIEVYGLSEYDAQVLTQTRALADYYEQVVQASGDPKLAANWTTGDLMGMLNADGRQIELSPVSGTHLGGLIALILKGELTGKLAKEILPKMYQSGEAAPVIMEREGLKAISDSGEIERIIDEVIAANPKQVEQYRGGKTSVMAFFIGQLMKATRGQANPATATEILKNKLG